MEPLRTTTRTIARRLLLLPAVLLLFGLLAANLHHHDAGQRDHHCALCTLGHTPAVAAADGAPAPVLARAAGDVSTDATDAPRVRRAGPRASRAPPVG